MKFIEAYKVGKKLDNAVMWKYVQIAISCIGMVSGILASFGIDLNLTIDEITAYAWAIVLALTGYLTVATTDKIGIGKKQEDKIPFVITKVDYPKDYDERGN